jgi:putative membrane protein
VSVIAWLAGMLYLPRLFVYHCGAKPGSETSETFKVMERRLMRAIINPAMGATWLFGIALVAAPEGPEWREPWLLAKLALVLALSALHGYCARWLRDFAADQNARPAKFYRIMNEVPTVLMILIVVLVVVRPF